MSEKELTEVKQALLLYLDAVDAASQTLRNNLKFTANFKQPQTQTQTPTASQVGDVNFLPESARKYIQKVTPRGDFCEVKMQYVSKDVYVEISEDLKHIGGVFVSAGKDSYWKIPTSEATTS